MKKVKRGVNSFIVFHPTDPDVKVHCKKLNQLEAIDYAWELGPKPVFRPETVGGLFKRAVTKVEGIEGEDGPYEWDRDPSVFFDPELDIKEDGKPVVPFWQHLLESIQESGVSRPNSTS